MQLDFARERRKIIGLMGFTRDSSPHKVLKHLREYSGQNRAWFYYAVSNLISNELTVLEIRPYKVRIIGVLKENCQKKPVSGQVQ